MNKDRLLCMAISIPILVLILFFGSATAKTTDSRLTPGPIITIGQEGELLRINTAKNVIEYSYNGGRSWIVRCSSQSYGTFKDLLLYEGEVLACTSKGVYASRNEGRSFISRYSNTSYCGEFLSLIANGDELLANTTKGLFVSRNSGRSWIKR